MKKENFTQKKIESYLTLKEGLLYKNHKSSLIRKSESSPF